jgi:hypothetical protein
MAADGVDLEEREALLRSVTGPRDTARFDSENPLVVRLIQRGAATGQIGGTVPRRTVIPIPDRFESNPSPTSGIWIAAKKLRTV